MGDVEPVVWLPEGVQRPPIPEFEQSSGADKPKRRDEFHLAKVYK